MLKSFDCTLYETTCKDVKQKLYGVAAYKAYSNCASTVGVNDANAMSCQVQHLAAAAVTGGRTHTALMRSLQQQVLVQQRC